MWGVLLGDIIKTVKDIHLCSWKPQALWMEVIPKVLAVSLWKTEYPSQY